MRYPLAPAPPALPLRLGSVVVGEGGGRGANQEGEQKFACEKTEIRMNICEPNRCGELPRCAYGFRTKIDWI
jgi:hypothetical protein